MYSKHDTNLTKYYKILILIQFKTTHIENIWFHTFIVRSLRL